MRIAAFTLRQHVEQAAFLWTLRQAESSQDPPNEDILEDINARLEANLDALAIAGSAAWPFIMDEYEASPDKGELFVAAVHALGRRHRPHIDLVVESARQGSGEDGLIGALAWLAPEALASTVRTWIASADPYCRYLAATAYFTHGVDPGPRLIPLLKDADARVRAQGVRIAERLRRSDTLEWLTRHLGDADPDVRLAAAAACVAMHHSTVAVALLREAVVSRSHAALRALRAVLAALPGRDAREWLGELAARGETRHLAVRGVGMLGSREDLPWLVRQMTDVAVAAPAAAAFLEIFGPVDDPDEYFYGDAARAAAALGVDEDTLDGRIPIADAFAALIRR